VPTAIKQYLSADEIRALVTPSDLRGALSVATTWGLIVASFFLVAHTPLWLGVPLAIILLGNRQLALAVLTHEAAHRSLFRTRWLNPLVGQWLCAYPTWNDTARYREHHLRHHRWAGTDRDPDLALIEPFPTTRASLLRKCARDLVGYTGLKRVIGLVLIDFGYLEYNVSGVARRLPQEGRRLRDVWRTGLRNVAGFAAVHAVVVAALWAGGLMWAYGLWWLAYLTTYSLFLRLRSIAEHACTERTADVMRNTRTTLANPLARLTVAPHHVNYHLEHHLLMTVPHYHLPRLHRLLRERGALENAVLADSYRSVLTTAASES